MEGGNGGDRKVKNRKIENLWITSELLKQKGFICRSFFETDV